MKKLAKYSFVASLVAVGMLWAIPAQAQTSGTVVRSMEPVLGPKVAPKPSPTQPVHHDETPQPFWHFWNWRLTYFR